MKNLTEIIIKLRITKNCIISEQTQRQINLPKNGSHLKKVEE